MTVGHVERSLALIAGESAAMPAVRSPVHGRWDFSSERQFDIHPIWSDNSSGRHGRPACQTDLFYSGQVVSLTLIGGSAAGANLAIFRTAVEALRTNKVASLDGALTAPLTLRAMPLAAVRAHGCYHREKGARNQFRSSQ